MKRLMPKDWSPQVNEPVWISGFARTVRRGRVRLIVPPFAKIVMFNRHDSVMGVFTVRLEQIKPDRNFWRFKRMREKGLVE